MESGKSAHDPLLQVHLNYIDSYQGQPSKHDRHVFKCCTTIQKFTQVPVIRVFGRTTNGRTVLVHIHGVYPYLYVEYGGDLDTVDQYIEGLYHEINGALCASLKRDKNDPRNAFVANIVLCKGVPFYGFHVGWKLYLKIYLLNSAYILKLADILRSGHVLGLKRQPHEAHIPHISQFFSDFNLFGCNKMSIFSASNNELEYRSEKTKTSYCELELDITADMIANRHEIEQKTFHSSFEGGTREESKTQLSNLGALWREDSERRNRLGVGSFKPPTPSQRTAQDKDKWYRHDELRAKFEELLATSETKADWKFDVYPTIPTAFEAVGTMLQPDNVVGPVGSLNDGEVENDDVLEVMRNDRDIIEEKEDYDDYDNVERQQDMECDEHDKGDGQEVGEIDQDRGSHPQMRSAQRITSRSKTYNSLLSFINLSQSSQSTTIKSYESTNEAHFHSIAKKLGIKPHNGLGFRAAPPSKQHVLNTIEKYGPYMSYQEPHYSIERDVPEVNLTHAGIEHKIVSDTVPYLPDFWIPPNDAYPRQTGVKILEYLPRPPSAAKVVNDYDKFLSSSVSQSSSRAAAVARSNMASATASSQRDYMSVLTIEIHVNSAPGKLPNPATDPVQAIFWRLLIDENFDQSRNYGMLVWGSGEHLRRLELISKWPIAFKRTEHEAIKSLIQMVRYYDPDILAGYELQKSSWGYLIERAQRAYGIDLIQELARTKPSPNQHSKTGDKWGLQHTTDIAVPGRHMLNIWRVIKKEVSLTQYTLENVVWHSFGERIPHYSNSTLTNWYSNCGTTTTGMQLAQLLDYYTSRLNYELKTIEKQELVGRYSEQARIIGIDYNSVFYRGSQFQVESFLARLTKKENFIMPSPSKKQVGEQNALEYIPLVMEPESQFYTSPVLVLDFQSLYPSIMIAYNYCYSTCLGRVVPWRGKNKMGFTELDLQNGVLSHLKDDISIAPNGIMYAKKHIRKSLLATMLSELLDTRVMLKEGMKFNKDDQAFQKSMNNRQLALKLIANVTYGYTSASYSGRMPCAEIADSIVLSGREILEKTIEIIQTTEKWGADVVYGDTDSIFVHLPGKSRNQAFDIGEDIAREITKLNPEPIKLKFEKVYHPCILQTKKRYVGYMYETRNQKSPIFDAKGTETVRRDGTPIVQKIEEKALRTMFETIDLSKVKSYLIDEWSKILSDDVSINEFCFAKEVKLGAYKSALLPPGAAISAKKMEADERAEPQYRERVPYVVINGAPGDRLIDRCIDPEELLRDPSLSLDARYYITKNIIPPLERMFNMMGANIRAWFDEMPKPHHYQGPGLTAVGNLGNYVKSVSCIMCGNKIESDGSSTNGVCIECQDNPSVVYTLEMRRKRAQQQAMALEAVCRNCAHLPPASAIECVSGDCPVYYNRVRTNTCSIGW